MTPLGGLFFGGATLTEHEDLAPSTGVVGRPVWGRGALLANLELRLGLATPAEAHAVRVQLWTKRMGDVSSRGARFFSSSFQVDPVGTAVTLLSWRDRLFEAGWDGEPIPGGGARLEALAELEEGLEMPPGVVDRLRRVQTELAETDVRPWTSLDLAESRGAWPGRWQTVFDLLEARGTKIQTVAATCHPAEPDTDLGRLQACLRGAAADGGFRGDGSLVVLTGATSWDVAHAVAAVLRHWNDGTSVVVRGGDTNALGAAMAAQGLASLGVSSQSKWRPALQLLPLAVELAYVPRDPYRVLELVTLPNGPFAGWLGLRLARALSSAPGIGGRAWQAAKQDIAAKTEEWALREASQPTDDAARARVAASERLGRIAEWLEGPGHDSQRGAPRAALLDVVERVNGWLQSRVARSQAGADSGSQADADEGDMLKAAVVQARAFRDALSHDRRDELDLVAARQLLEEVSLGSVSRLLATEEAGRIDVVDCPAGLRCSRDLVVWWHCVNGTQQTAPFEPWRSQERRALNAAGVRLQDTAAVLAAEADGWRNVVLSARRRLVLVMPSTALGRRLDPHPIWDEIVARMRLEPRDQANVTMSVEQLLRADGVLAAVVPRVATTSVEPLALPIARREWRPGVPLFGDAVRHTATSLESLLGCALHWVLSYPAALDAGRAIAVPKGPLMNGSLGHRLVEELQLAGAFNDSAALQTQASGILDRLVQEEAAVLLRPGMTFELSQLRRQLINSAKRLAAFLTENGLSIVAVEEEMDSDWGGRQLSGRLDLSLRDPADRAVVLDLKWGRSSYRDKLANGVALQLAVYAWLYKSSRGGSSFPATGYFSLSRGQVLTTDADVFADVEPIEGPSMSETWANLDRTVVAVERLLRGGVVPVAGVTGATPLLESAQVDETQRHQHVVLQAPCGDCEHGTLCGRAWERLA